MKRLTTAAVWLALISIAPAEAAPSLRDCERIFQQSARQNQITENVRAKSYGVSGPAAQCAFGKEQMPLLARIVAEKRAVRSNSCWTPADEARYQRILVLQKNFVRSVAAACVRARNPGAAVATYRTRSLTKD